MLVLDRIGKIYPNGVNALQRFSADIRLGEIVAIIGGSGCGNCMRGACGFGFAVGLTATRPAFTAMGSARAYLWQLDP